MRWVMIWALRFGQQASNSPSSLSACTYSLEALPLHLHSGALALILPLADLRRHAYLTITSATQRSGAKVIQTWDRRAV